MMKKTCWSCAACSGAIMQDGSNKRILTCLNKLSPKCLKVVHSSDTCLYWISEAEHDGK